MDSKLSKHTPTELLTLIGMRGDTFISLSFFDQIFSADFLSKHSKKLTSIGLFWHTAQFIEYFKSWH